jgi:hypothetical protein
MKNLILHGRDLDLVNSILLLWNKYLAVTISKLNDHIECSLKAVAGDVNSKADTLPLCIYYFFNLLDRYLSERGKSIEQMIVKENVDELDIWVDEIDEDVEEEK